MNVLSHDVHAESSIQHDNLNNVFTHLNMYHNHVRINHHQGDNQIRSLCNDNYFSRGKLGINILFQIWSGFEYLAQ